MQNETLSDVTFLGRGTCWGFALCIAFALLAGFGVPAPASADVLDLIVERNVDDGVLSDGLPDETGRWRSSVQQVFNSKSQRLERRLYEYFDPAPSLNLDVVWYPQDESANANRAGPISGIGRMVWRRHHSSAWDQAAVVRSYSGEMQKGRPHGKGELVTAEGLVYDGEWRDGRASGPGHLKLPGGEEYVGSFQLGKADGRGRVFGITGEIFEGSFRKGLRHGTGKTRLPSGFAYDSSWLQGVERPWSRRIRLAQTGGPSNLGGGADVRLEVAVQRKPVLPQGVEANEVVAYESANDGNRITVQPADKQLMGVWKGNGQLQTEVGSSTIRNGIFGIDRRYIEAVPPTFVIGFENRTSQPVTIQSLRLEVSESDTDNQPAIQMISADDTFCVVSSYATNFTLENYGESPANGTQMRISFGPPGAGSGPQFTKQIGNLAGRMQISFEQELKQSQVNVSQLKRLSNDGIRCPSGSLPACLSSIRSDPTFGSLGPQLDLRDLQIIVPVSGSLDYVWTDNKGTPHRRSSPFQVRVGLGKFKLDTECGEGAAPEPQQVKAIQLQLDATNYAVPLQFQRTVAAGQVARFALPVGAAKSSDHAFRIVAALSNGQEVSSLPISLLYFRPRVLPSN